ncbi:MAG: hypothetical protein V4653_16160 [Pseudomonadota bacterium]
MNTPVQATAPSPSEIQGVVDNIAAGRVYGWAWNPSRPEERVAIELRLGQKTVAQTIAAQERADLKGAGVGDGCHAFELRLTPELVEPRAEIFIVARSADGLEVPLPILGARRPLALVPSAPGGQNAQSLVRSVQALAGAQRDLSEKLASLAVRVPEATATADELAARIATLEGWCLRIDERLAALPAPAPAAATRRRLDPWQLVLAGVAISAVAGAVILAWVGAFPGGVR